MAKHNWVYRTVGVWCSATSLGFVFFKLTVDKGCIGDVTNDFNVTTFVKLIGLEADPLWFGGAIKFGWRSQMVVIEDNLTSQ